MNNFRYLDNVVTLSVNEERCVACGMCTQVCPHGVLGLDGCKIRILDRNGCMECGACARNCPTGALSVTPGVGCASYIIQCWLKGKETAVCGGPGCC